MALFVGVLIRPTSACRTCESLGHDPRIIQAALPPVPIPKSGIGNGLPTYGLVSKFIDHLPLHRQETIFARHGWGVRRSTLCDTCGSAVNS